MVGDWSTGDTGTVVDAEEPGGPDDDDDEFRAPDPDDEWLERAVVGFSAWLDSAGERTRLEDRVSDNRLVKPK